MNRSAHPPLVFNNITQSEFQNLWASRLTLNQNFKNVHFLVMRFQILLRRQKISLHKLSEN